MIFVLVAVAANASVDRASITTSVSPGGDIENANDWSWRGKSKLIFDNIVKGSPFFVCRKVEAKMVNEIKERKLFIATEVDLLKVQGVNSEIVSGTLSQNLQCS